MNTTYRTSAVFLFLIPTLIASVVLMGCEEEAKTEGFESIVLSGDICPDCSIVTVQYPQMIEESPLQRVIERSIREEIIEALTLQESGLAGTIEEAMESFQAENRRINRRFSDENAQWEAEITGKVLHKSARLLGIHLSFDINAGGAHGNVYDHLLTFDVERAREIEIDEVLRINDEFVSVAERHFRDDQGLEPGQNLNEGGFIFLSNHFELPETMGLGTNGIVLLYQQGEISSAMDEPVVAIIPYSEASRFLKDSFKGAF